MATMAAPYKTTDALEGWGLPKEPEDSALAEIETQRTYEKPTKKPCSLEDHTAAILRSGTGLKDWVYDGERQREDDDEDR